MPEVSLDVREGRVSVSYGETAWVEGLEIRLRGKPLAASQAVALTGEDRFGPYSGHLVTYGEEGGELLKLALKLYPARDAVLLEARVLSELTGLAVGDSFLLSPLDVPVLRLREAEFLLFTWGMTGPGGEGEWPHPVYGRNLGGIPRDKPFSPLVLTHGSHSLVISPASHFPVSPLRAGELGGREVARGLHGAIDRLPKGTVLKTLLVFGGEPFEALLAWGDFLLALGGKGRPGTFSHPVLSRLGYWTDYGAYYSDLFHPADEKVLTELARYFQEEDIPVGYFGLDLWYEYQRAGLATAYRPDGEKFPRGLGPVARETGIPMFLHLSGFSRDNAYRGRYRFWEGEEAACPAEPRFYRELARDLLAEGAMGVWHDHLRNQQGRVPELRMSLTAAEEWFRRMADAFSRAGLPLMLSVPTVGFWLSASGTPGVIAARSGEDYLVRHETQLAMLPPEVKSKYELVPYRDFIRTRFLVGWLLYSLGMYPFHDVFITDSSHPEGFAEPRAMDEALMRALSAGPVGIGDKLGHVDKGILKRLCFPDGELAKPDRPARPFWGPLREGLLVAVAETALPAGTWRYLAVYNLTEAERDYRLPLGDFGLEGMVVYDYFRRRTVGEPGGRLPPEGGDYYLIAPRLNGVALLGLLDKFIALPSGRCQVEPVRDGLRAAFRTPPVGAYSVGAHCASPLEIEVQGAEIVGRTDRDGVHRFQVRPRREAWGLILRGGDRPWN